MEKLVDFHDSCYVCVCTLTCLYKCDFRLTNVLGFIFPVQSTLCTDSHLIQTPHYYGQFPLSLGKESPYIFSKFNLRNMDTLLMWTLSMTPSVSVLAWFDRVSNKDVRTNNSWIDQYKLVVDTLYDPLSVRISRV